jgi:hypothetical protein
MPSDSFAKNTKGAAGVHLVVAQLSLEGYVALPAAPHLKLDVSTNLKEKEPNYGLTPLTR